MDSVKELEEERIRLRTYRREYEKIPEEFKNQLQEINYELWNFLEKENENIFKIKNWEIYRRAAESVKISFQTPTVDSEISKPTWVPTTKYDQNLLKLLRAGRIAEFNIIRRQSDYKPSIMTGIDLRASNLIGADLRYVDLVGADLSGAKLDQANLSGANLTRA